MFGHIFTKVLETLRVKCKAHAQVCSADFCG